MYARRRSVKQKNRIQNQQITTHKNSKMSIKKIIAVATVGLVLTSCSSRGWSCKARYVNTKSLSTEKKAA